MASGLSPGFASRALSSFPSCDTLVSPSRAPVPSAEPLPRACGHRTSIHVHPLLPRISCHVCCRISLHVLAQRVRFPAPGNTHTHTHKRTPRHVPRSSASFHTLGFLLPLMVITRAGTCIRRAEHRKRNTPLRSSVIACGSGRQPSARKKSAHASAAFT
ncbi:LAQU0S03e00936g1_1 [Lachancea quebecensis]|uniref:LAQU0S03e00936g1_1 n=1 Tax=Lachancea quebecensis TaxID=1654605 RepID=A0A0P1KP36_9SACH|nr:LAQU0S03e00936g1_1 [Lachancea quebecensis]